LLDYVEFLQESVSIHNYRCAFSVTIIVAFSIESNKVRVNHTRIHQISPMYKKRKAVFQRCDTI